MDEASKKRKERLEALKKRKLESTGGDDSVRYMTILHQSDIALPT